MRSKDAHKQLARTSLKQLSNFSRELAFNSNLPNLIVLNVAFYMYLIRQFDSAHVKCAV